MPVPHINVLIVKHDSTSVGVLAGEDGYIQFKSAIPPSQLAPNGARQWWWTTKGYADTPFTEEQPSMYGVAVTLEQPLRHYFNDRPYVDGTTWSANGWSPDPDGELAPLSKVEDQADALTPTDGVMGDGANGIWDGDRRLPVDTDCVNICKEQWQDKDYGSISECIEHEGCYREWKGSGQLSPFDIDRDGLVELPTASDPDNVKDEYTLQQVLKHTITHEICHALAGTSHSADPACLMYKWSMDWKRDGYLSDWYRALLRVHNKKR